MTVFFGGYSLSMVGLWVIAIIVFLILEGITAGLVTIWFAVGALAALIAAMFHAPVWLQIVWFFVVSIAAFALTRPLAKTYVNSKTQPTNADMYLGRECVVTETIDNLEGRGAVSVGGKVWTARSLTGATLPEGSRATVQRIEGVKLIVDPIHEPVDAEA